MFSQKTTKSILLLMIVVLLVVTTACGKNTDSVNEKVVTYAQIMDPTTLDVHRATGDQGRNVYINICETLFTYDSDWNLEPKLIERYEQVSDLEWVFYLKEGVKFSNGEPFTSEVVGWNLDRGVDTEYPRQAWDYAPYYDKWEAIDEHTLKIYTKIKAFNLPLQISDIPMLEPKHSEEIGEEAIGTDIVGTGPYILESWEKDQQIVLVANENYWGGKPNVDKYIIKTIPEQSTQIAEFLSGELDIIEGLNFESLEMIKKEEGVKIDSRYETRVIWLGFNTLDWSPNQELQDSRVRQALNYAVNKEAIVNDILGGYGRQLATWYREDFPAYDPNIKGFEYNPEKAKQLLADAGYPNGFSIKLQSNTGSTAKGHEISQAVAADLAAVGVKCEVLTEEFSAMRNILINGQDAKKAEGLYSWSWASKPGMVGNWITGLIQRTGITSYNAIEGYEEIADAIFNSETVEEYEGHLKVFQQMLVDDPPFLYLPQLQKIFAISERLDWSPNEHYYIEAVHMDVIEK